MLVNTFAVVIIGEHAAEAKRYFFFLCLNTAILP